MIIMSKSEPSFFSRSPYGEVLWGGKTISEIVELVGQTPFYAYDSKLIQNRIQMLTNMLPKEIKIHYAIKANPLPSLVDFISQHVDGLDVASAGELSLALALATAIPRNEISFAGPGKKTSEILLAIESGIVINVESLREIKEILKIEHHTGKKARIALRINPNYELKGSGMKMGGGPKPFGIDIEKIPEILKIVMQNHMQLDGFHVFSGSQNLKSESLGESFERNFEMLLELKKTYPKPVPFFNLGGGFGIPYFEGEQPLDLAPIGRTLQKLVDRLKVEAPATQIVLEFGRYLVGESGIYVCQIVDKKESRGQFFLICDGGLHHHLAASGNLGQVIRRNYPLTTSGKIDPNQTELVNIVGPLCTPLDILAHQVNLPKAEIDQYVVIFQSGAYGATASPQKFLSHPPLKEVFL